LAGLPFIESLTMAKLAPSILSADFGRLRETVEILNDSTADVLHVDVMDGRFVPNISFGFPVMDALARYSKKPLDVHLMIEEPEKFAERFVKSGAAWLSFHQEATPHAHRLLEAVKTWGARPGLAINPQTGIESIPYLLQNMEFVNVMTVNPGFGGQKFIKAMYSKIKALDALRKSHQAHFEIEIDGGVNLENIPALKSAGADVFVAGNALFSLPDLKAGAFQFSQILS
jgi:ribulose-phosphate 3-epimerase